MKFENKIFQREIIITKDGSTTFFVPELNENYHSTNGSIQEAKHVFIKYGLHLFLEKFPTKQVRILEIGLGTGLNALLTMIEAEKLDVEVKYTGIEAFPMRIDEIDKINYVEVLNEEKRVEKFLELHQVNWEEMTSITNNFSLLKMNRNIEDIDFENEYDLIFFDAFGYTVQPELWTENIFNKMYASLSQNGLLSTYACRSIIKNNMKSVGFFPEKKEGALGKREMLIAWKLSSK